MSRLGKIVLSIVIGLVLLEVALQLAGIGYLGFQARQGPDDGRHRVLCLGDSHTFGIWLAKDDAYPSRLDARLRQDRPAGEWSVENAGVPGFATGDVLDRLEAQTRQRRYDLIVVMAGANDRWKGAERASKRPWYESAKTVKLVMLIFKREPPPRVTEVDGVVRPDDIAGRPTEGKENSATVSLVDRAGVNVRFEQKTTGELESDADLTVKLETNYAEMIRIASSVNTKIVFFSYPNSENDLGLANRVMATAARKGNVHFLSMFTVMAEASKRHRFEDLFFADRHPSSLTSELLARSVYNYMVEFEGLTGEPVRELFDGLPTAPPRESSLEFSGTLGKDLTVQLKTDPGRRVHFFLSLTPGETDVLGHRIPIGRDALFEKSIDAANPTLTQVVSGADGVARLDLTPILGADVKPGAMLHAVAAILGIDGAPGLHDITPAKTLELR